MSEVKMRLVYFSSTYRLHLLPKCSGRDPPASYVNDVVIDHMEKHNRICGRCGWSFIDEVRRARDANRD